ncbi:MAG: hypothetical protein ACD_8C00124G0028 [uncultured bacterium]|nr:MAG: hypothetical protein ACD_8C00124G0028 [uncultured bacterium]
MAGGNLFDAFSKQTKKENVMSKKRPIVGVALGTSAIIGKKGVVKHEIINSLAWQVQRLHLAGVDVFINIFNPWEYYQGNIANTNLRCILGKNKVSELFADAFKKKRMVTCVLDSTSSAGQLIKEVVDFSIVPIIAGQLEKDGFESGGIEHWTLEDAYFAFLCKTANAQMGVFAGNYYSCKHRDQLYSTLFEHCPYDMRFHHEPHFLIRAISKKIGIDPETLQISNPMRVTGLPYMFY